MDLTTEQIDQKEINDEIKREEAQEIKEEPMYIWIEENKDKLRKEYCDLEEDEFNEYCKKTYHEEVN